MGKSLGNAIYLSDSDEDIVKKVQGAVTDPNRIRKDDKGNPEICMVAYYHNLFSSKEACVILSTSGMCQVGRVRHHIKALVGNPNATILFVGFSTEGSLASLLKDNKRKTIHFKIIESKGNDLIVEMVSKKALR